MKNLVKVNKIIKYVSFVIRDILKAFKIDYRCQVLATNSGTVLANSENRSST